VDLDSIRDDLATVVHQAVEAVDFPVWIEDHDPAVEADAAGNDGARAQQGSQVEHVRADDDPGTEPRLAAGHRGDRRGDFGRVRRERRDQAEQCLGQAQALADPLQSEDQQLAGGHADHRIGQESRRRKRHGHSCHPPL
jgi:hypothetical protein